VSSVTDFREMFEDALDFNNGGTGSIDSWQINTSSAAGVNMNSMFYDARRFNQPIGSWDMSNVIDVGQMFTLTEDFNQDIGSWDMSNLTSLYAMFSSTLGFNNGGTGSIDSWNTSNVTRMDFMFYNSPVFNQPIGSWNTSNVTRMDNMFYGLNQAHPFNQNIGSWDVSSVTTLYRMFRNATSFNNSGSDSIRNWNTSNVTDIREMLYGANAFDQPLDGWDVSSITTATNFMFTATGLSTTNYDLTLIGWGAQSGSVNSGVNIHFGGSTYTSGSLADSRRQDLINAGWTITDGGYAP
jgi:surface protein